MKRIYLLLISLFLLPVFSFPKNTSAGKDTVTTKSGLKYIVLKKGHGEKAAAGKEVSVNYIGYLLDGSEFDNSYKRGKPFKFILGEGKVIKGWDEGIALMHVQINNSTETWLRRKRSRKHNPSERYINFRYSINECKHS